MKSLFVDTNYLIAIVNPKDQWHPAAIRFGISDRDELVTTTWVLVEFLDGMARAAQRGQGARLIRKIMAAGTIEIVRPDWQSFLRGLELYEQRPDKEWSLTDCLSFVLMSERGITDALTADHHFQQAGFKPLLRTDTN